MPVSEENNCILLAIESSCDDTAAAICKNGKLLSNVVARQQVHEKYGGVVPELASREHSMHMIPVVHDALQIAGVNPSQLDAIACTRGPGLLGSLLVGNAFAKSYAFSLGIPLIQVHHMLGHIHALLDCSPPPTFPFLCLTVSGGHTQLILVKNSFTLEILGETMDDAAGEAFDKAGKMLGLPYPAGPQIDKLSKEGSPIFSFAKPQVPGLNFSFSGLKTSILYFLQKQTKENPDFIKNNLQDLCASIQTTIIDILLEKIQKAIALTGITDVGIVGGVSANAGLRIAAEGLVQSQRGRIFIPPLSLCTDNAGMIAIVAYHMFQAKQFAPRLSEPVARWELASSYSN